jgi:TP901 family phage tail tape measure protein
MAADRVTRVSLTANVSNYITGMQRAAVATRETGTAAERLGQQRESIDKLGKGMLTLGSVAAASVALSVAKFAEFDAAVSKIQAATHASAGEMVSLRDAAIDAGAKTVFSATEAANAITELSKAGVSTKDILGGGLNGALSLASAGELNVADAASIAATAMTQFKLKGAEIPHVADLLAAGAGKAQGSVQDLAAALNQGGLVASQAGQSIDDTTGVLAAFASQGLLGSDAGTSLKTALLALESPSTQAAGVMKQYGINVYDSSGKMDSFSEIAGTLRSKLGGLTDEQRNAALATIFGNDAVRAANVLYSDGADGISKWTKNVNDNGYAAETARINLNNLKGDLEQLGGAFDTALIQTGSGANGSLRELTQSATFLVGAVGGLPKPVLAAGLATAGLTAAVTLTGGAALVAVPKFAAFKATLAASNISLKTAALRSAGAGLAIGGLGIAIGALVSEQAEFKAGTAALTDTLDASTGALTKYTRSSVAKSLADKGVFAAGKEAGISQRELTDAVLEGGDAIDKVKAKFGKTNTFGGVFTGISERSGFAQLNLSKLSEQVQQSQVDFKDLKKSGTEVADSQGDVASATADAATGLQQLSGAADTGTSSLDDLKKAIEGFGSAQLDVDSATRSFYDSVDKLTSSVKDNGQTLDVHTEKGRNNQAALEQIASSTLSLASAQLSQTGSQKVATAAVQQGRDAFIAAAQKAGLSAAAAGTYADKLGLIPKNVSTAIAQTGINPALAKLDALIQKIRNVPGYKAVVIDQQIRQTGAAPGVVKAAYATGGRIAGPGTGTSDSIPAMLSNGEYVIKASSVSKYGVARLDAINAGSVRKFANGGYVQNLAAAQKQYDAEVKYEKAAEEAVKAAKTAARKRDAKADLAEAKADVVAAKRKLDAAKAAPQGASLSDKLSFRTANRQGNFDGSDAISSLYQMAQDADKYSGKARKTFLNLASASEAPFIKLQKRSTLAAAAVESASDKLSDLKDQSSSLASSVSQSVSKFDVGNYRSATSIKAGLSRSVGSASEFAALLKKLRSKGISPAMLTEIASLGTAEGLPLARSLAQATAGDIKSINASYAQLGTIGAAAGKTVADANFGALIKSADIALAAANKNADKITKAINDTSGRLTKVIGKALGLPGYSAGGYTGRGGVLEPRGIVHAGEYVMNASTVARPGMLATLQAMQNGQPGYAQGGYVQPTYVRGGGAASIDYDRLAAALSRNPAKQINVTNDIKPIQAVDPQTVLTVLGRELNRGMAGLNH